MSVNLKPVLALLISILIFAGFLTLADKEMFDFVQTRFYNPSVLRSYISANSRDAELVQGLIFELQNKFAAVLNEPAVQSSFLYNQSPDDIYERSRIFGILLESTTGLHSVQFVDSNGIRLHYSTSARDIISQNANSTTFRNYTDDPASLPYERVSVSANNSAKFSMDENGDRIIFSFPFNDSMDVYRGTALYNVSVRALAEKLAAEGRLKVNENIFVTEIPQGILLGSPNISKSDILSKVSMIWNGGIHEQEENLRRLTFGSQDSVEARVTFDSGDSGVKFSLISFKTVQGIFLGRLVNDNLFHISDSMKNILLISMFLTFYLILLFIINFRSNSVMLVKTRINHLRENLFEQLYINKSRQERAKWILELEQRREEIRRELKRGLKFNQSTEKNINAVIDKSWDELLAVIKSGGEMRSIAADNFVTQVKAKEAETIEVIEEIEVIEKIGEVEEIEEIEELAEIAGVEEIEEVEETQVPQPKKGLLAHAASKESVEKIERENRVAQRRRLLALVSDIEFNRDIHAGNTEENDEDLDTKLNIVSPFSSMFVSLDSEKN